MNRSKDSLRNQRVNRLITIGLILYSVFYGLTYFIPYPDSVPVFVDDIIVWSVFFLLWGVLFIAIFRYGLDVKGIVWFCLSLVVGVAILALRPWMAIGLISQHFTGPIVFQLAVYSKLYIAFNCVNFGIVITLLS